MKKIILSALLILTGVTVYAQSLGFTYDAAGNRIKRTIVISKSEPASESISGEMMAERVAGVDISIAPNPTKGILKVGVTGISESAPCAITLFNMNGQLLQSVETTSGITELDLGEYPDGVYLLHVALNGEETAYRIIKN